jgi:hypothetical protein
MTAARDSFSRAEGLVLKTCSEGLNGGFVVAKIGQGAGLADYCRKGRRGVGKDTEYNADGLPPSGSNFVVYSKPTRDDPGDNDSVFPPLVIGSDHVASDTIGSVNCLCSTCYQRKTRIRQRNIDAHSNRIDGGFWLGSDYITVKTPGPYAQLFSFLKPFFVSSGVVVFDSCSPGFEHGLLTKLSAAFGVSVPAYRDPQYSDWTSQNGEGPSNHRNAARCATESSDPWFDDNLRPIVGDKHWHLGGQAKWT